MSKNSQCCFEWSLVKEKPHNCNSTADGNSCLQVVCQGTSYYETVIISGTNWPECASQLFSSNVLKILTLWWNITTNEQNTAKIRNFIVTEKKSHPVTLASEFIIWLSHYFFPYSCCSIERAGSQDLPKFRMGPCHTPHWSTMCLQDNIKTL